MHSPDDQNDPRMVLIPTPEILAENKEPAIVVLEVSRENIEKGLYAPALDILMVLSDTAENFKLYSKSLVLSVDGYDDDPREIYEIPEIRSFFSQLNDQWPYWLWFLEHEHGSSITFLSLLCDVESAVPGQLVFKSVREVGAFILDAFARCAPAYLAFDVDPEEVEKNINALSCKLGVH